MPKRRQKPIPLTSQPSSMMKSRKKARMVTTQFHQLTHQRAKAVQEGNTEEIKEIDQALQDMGGRVEYQRASQLSTSFHSTSKWVLGTLTRKGWIHGIPVTISKTTDNDSTSTQESSKRNLKKPIRRNVRLLEIGAINTELLDAAAAQIEVSNGGEGKQKRAKFALNVRAIDLHAMDERIEEADFLTIPLRSSNIEERYDVLVCSMVINCVPTPQDRGKMLARLYHHLRPNGLLFLTLPKYCLTKSAFLTLEIFEQLLGQDGVGFEIEETKQSPKVAFFVCRRPEQDFHTHQKLNKSWTKRIIRNKGKKYPNQFCVVLEQDEVFGTVWNHRKS